MPPAKRAKAAPVKPAHPGDPCDAPRLETYEVESQKVTRCMECGASQVE